jgi:small subunit ribosomal protein S20
MANIKSAQKRARQSVKKRQRNLARKSAIKTAMKKVFAAIENKSDAVALQNLFNEAQAQLARAKNKGLIHRNNASRKISRLAKRVAVVHAGKAGTSKTK